jgi:hypothetical protein
VWLDLVLQILKISQYYCYVMFLLLFFKKKKQQKLPLLQLISHHFYNYILKLLKMPI